MSIERGVREPEQNDAESLEQQLEATYGTASIVIIDGKRELNQIKVREKKQEITRTQAQEVINQMRKDYEARLDTAFEGSTNRDNLRKMALGEIFNESK